MATPWLSHPHSVSYGLIGGGSYKSSAAGEGGLRKRKPLASCAKMTWNPEGSSGYVLEEKETPGPRGGDERPVKYFLRRSKTSLPLRASISWQA